LGESVHLSSPSKNHNSGFRLPPIAATKKNKTKINKLVTTEKALQKN